MFDPVIKIIGISSEFITIVCRYIASQKLRII